MGVSWAQFLNLIKMRKAKVFVNGIFAGELRETEDGYVFSYEENYPQNDDAKPVSLTFPLSETEFVSPILHPFFDGLIPEGWLLEAVEKTWKINPRDRMGLLLATGRDTIGNVSITE